MGTNYYWNKNNKCECCGREDSPIHIGKSSMGWCFSLHVIPGIGINNLSDWVKLFDTEGSFITNEYGATISKSEMLNIITTRRGSFDPNKGEIWFEKNHACLGPNFLARSIVDNIYCVGHGEGTWDNIVGEFS